MIFVLLSFTEFVVFGPFECFSKSVHWQIFLNDSIAFPASAQSNCGKQFFLPQSCVPDGHQHNL